MTYEINFLVLQSKTAELEKIRKSTEKFIESFGVKIIEKKSYLKRKLAYEIQHENYGFFTVLRFESKEKFDLEELKNKLNQTAKIARYIIIKADELPSLKEQDTEKLEKIHTNKESIKSEDVEKALTEQKKAKVEKKQEKTKEKVALTETTDTKKEKKEVHKDKTSEKSSATKKAKKATTDQSSPKKASINKKEDEADKKSDIKKKEVEKKETSSKKSPTKEKEEKPSSAKTKKKEDEVSLDELDKKLDEILNS